MRRFLLPLLAVLAITLPPPADAARDLAPIPASDTLRLVVITAPGCIYCRLFRRDVEPRYEKSKHGDKIPLVYIDINDDAADKLALTTPITVVPTVVLVENNQELSRIAGYVGPTNFFLAFKHMLSRL